MMTISCECVFDTPKLLLATRMCGTNGVWEEVECSVSDVFRTTLEQVYKWYDRMLQRLY